MKVHAGFLPTAAGYTDAIWSALSADTDNAVCEDQYHVPRKGISDSEGRETNEAHEHKFRYSSALAYLLYFLMDADLFPRTLAAALPAPSDSHPDPPRLPSTL